MSTRNSGKNFEELEKASYSKLSTFEQCPRRFMYKYEQKKRSATTSLALEIGTISHYGKELVGLALIRGEKPDCEAIKQVVMNGYDEYIEKIVDENGEPVNELGDGCQSMTETVHVPGVIELKEKYFFEWYEKDNKSGMDYDEKLAIYFKNLDNFAHDTEWTPIACEPEFDFDFNGLFRLYGFIDRVDMNSAGDLRVVDYKSSKKVFDDKDIKTPLQMFVYTLAIEHMYGKTPVEHLYDFMFIDQVQSACSKGYYSRGMKKLLKLWEEICACRESGVYVPKATPLCHWCDYCRTNPNATDDFKDECMYFSLWTPNNRTFEKNKLYDVCAGESENKAEGFWF